MKSLKIVLCTMLLCSGHLLTKSQTDNSSPKRSRLTLMAGPCVTVNMYKPDQGYMPDQIPEQNKPLNTLGSTVALYYSGFKSKHYLFQTGMEYTIARYFKPYFSPESGKYAPYYYSAKISLHTVTIPAYFNVLLCNQKLYIGAGPHLDVFIYPGVSAYKSRSADGHKIINRRVYSRLVEPGMAAKIGANFPCNKGLITVEGMLHSNFFSVFPGSSTLINQYVSVVAGYTF